jgi:tRNA dimethylallyltransferase
MSEKNKTPKIIVVLGPTASGKSDLGVELAIEFNGEVISADSRQVYTWLDIGTGKITKSEMKGVPHHLLDVSPPEKIFTVADFKRLGEEAIKSILEKGKLPIICGGTGFYIEALLGETSIPEVLPNPELRKELEDKNAEELFDILQKLDPERAETIDAKNKRRLVRAIEICKELGKVPKIPNGKSQITNKFQILKIGIKVPDEELKKRINIRLEKRIEIGMIEEAEKLHKDGLSYERMRELGLEYGALVDFLDNKITKEEMVARLQTEIWQYAKRQMTWFKRDTEIKWFNPKDPLVPEEVKRFLEN